MTCTGGPQPKPPRWKTELAPGTTVSWKGYRMTLISEGFSVWVVTSPDGGHLCTVDSLGEAKSIVRQHATSRGIP